MRHSSLAFGWDSYEALGDESFKPCWLIDGDDSCNRFAMVCHGHRSSCLNVGQALAEPVAEFCDTNFHGEIIAILGLLRIANCRGGGVRATHT